MQGDELVPIKQKWGPGSDKRVMEGVAPGRSRQKCLGVGEPGKGGKKYQVPEGSVGPRMRLTRSQQSSPNDMS